MNTAGKLTLATLLLLGRGGIRILVRYTQSTEHRGPSTEAKAVHKLLYYRNPMGLPDTSPVPKKDSMGMDYVPVYEGEAECGRAIQTSRNDKVQKLGVKSEAAALRELDRTLRVTGRIEINERRTYAISPKFEGWVEHLYVNTTGADRRAKASRCSRCTARNWSRRKANTHWHCRDWPR